jgi:predicted MPP superfamily phosphohydrolase
MRVADQASTITAASLSGVVDWVAENPLHAVSVLFVLRRIVLLTILIVPQRFWLGRGWRLIARLRRSSWRTTGYVCITMAAIAIVLVLYDRIFRKFLPGTVSIWIAPIVQLWVFTSTFAFICVKAVHAIEWSWSKLTQARTTVDRSAAMDPSRRHFFRYAASFAGTAPFLAALYGYTRERLRFEIVRVTVPIPNLPTALNGFRIVQLSDIHIGDFMPREEIRRAVAEANTLEPDLAVITGDFLTGRGDPLAECIEELSLLKASLGVWGCNGNHEIYAGAEDAAEDLFRIYGMTLLRKRATQLEWKGGSLNLIGVDYQHDVQLTGAMRPTLDGVESLVRQGMLNILISHNPNTFYSAASLGIGLTVAGHTHGGQINLGVGSHFWSPARFMTDFVAGLYQLPIVQTTRPLGALGNQQAFLYVNRGLGTLGVPARLGAAPEITLLTLQTAP